MIRASNATPHTPPSPKALNTVTICNNLKNELNKSFWKNIKRKPRRNSQHKSIYYNKRVITQHKLLSVGPSKHKKNQFKPRRLGKSVAEKQFHSKNYWKTICFIFFLSTYEKINHKSSIIMIVITIWSSFKCCKFSNLFRFTSFPEFQYLMASKLSFNYGWKSFLLSRAHSNLFFGKMINFLLI